MTKSKSGAPGSLNTRLSPAERDRLREEERKAAFAAFWCGCGNPSHGVSYHEDNERGAACSKHHWTCDDCGKVVQVG